MDYNFEIVFKKIAEANRDISTVEIQVHAAELDEIDVLRKIVIEKKI